jgi:hypothetical protein
MTGDRTFGGIRVERLRRITKLILTELFITSCQFLSIKRKSFVGSHSLNLLCLFVTKLKEKTIVVVCWFVGS